MESNGKLKTAYIGGALTDIRLTIQETLEVLNARHEMSMQAALEDRRDQKTDDLKRFYEQLALAWERVMGVSAFVPHHYYDPKQNVVATPEEVYAFERAQIMERTSVLIVVADEPSWGGGMEVGWADEKRIPIIMLRSGGVSRLLRGTRALHRDLVYTTIEDALRQFESVIPSLNLVRA